MRSRYDEPRVGAVIPVYNGARFLGGLLNSIFENTDGCLIHVVVVSNEGVEDGVDEIFKRWKAMPVVERRTPIELIQNTTNLGFGPSVNQGIRRLYEDPTINYIGVFNVDQEVRENWLYWLLRALFVDERTGMASSNLIEDGNSEEFQKRWYPDIEIGNPMTVYHRSKGCPWLFPRHVLEEIGLMDECYAYSQYEDSAWFVELARSGWDFVKIQNSYAYHYVGSEGQRKAREVTGRDFALENRHKFIDRYGTVDMDQLMPRFYKPIIEVVK